MKNLGQMLKQAQEMQGRMAKVQEELAAMEVVGKAGAGTVVVTLNGKGEARGVKIDPALLSGPEDVEVLEDLMVAAINDAKSQVEAKTQEKMSEITGGIQLPPGFKMPF
jgi:DNA-binding YbaB/EbfC family protein